MQALENEMAVPQLSNRIDNCDNTGFQELYSTRNLSDPFYRIQSQKALNKLDYLSLKFGGTVTFYNGGVTTILGRPNMFTPNGKIPKEGLTLLNMFGIDVDLFKEVFYMYDKKRKGGNKKIIERKKATSELTHFARTVVGYGYHLVHKMNNGTIHYEQITSSNYKKYADHHLV